MSTAHIVVNKFNALEIEQQISLCERAGVFLSIRNNEHYLIKLFSLHDFYVEIIYNRQTKMVILARAFREMSKLDPYLDKMDLGDLFGQ